MKSRCLSCIHHHADGARHTCDKCPEKTILGMIAPDMKFIEHCRFYKKADH